MTREINLEGYGTIIISPISFKDREYESVDSEGKPLKWISGTATRGHFENEQGIEVSQALKKVEVEGEVFLLNKFSPTKEVKSDEIEVIDDNSAVYRATERVIYKVFVENDRLKKLLNEERKTLKFGFCAGSGFKMQEGYLTAWKNDVVLFGVRGDFEEVLTKFKDDVVEIDIIPERTPEQKKKLLKILVRG